jgi:chromosomal replication initiator protein
MSLTCPTADAVFEIERKLLQRIGQRRFQLWFKNATKIQIDGQQLKLQVPNNHVKGWIENHFLDVLREIASATIGGPVEVVFEFDPALLKSEASTTERSEVPEENVPQRTNRLSAGRKIVRKLRNNLDSFIVGPENLMAYNAIQMVLEKIHTQINPLFIHGGCGLGKTHLLQGLCNALSEKRPDIGWHYVSGEEFTNQFIQSMKSGSLDAFRHQYRNVDVLVIDDVHFLANKRATQEEFLHTYNAIDAAGKQVVMASDVHPKLMKEMNNSLVNRFISGMVIEIKAPDETTRAKIIRARSQQMGQEIQETVVRMLASRIKGNVREIEGTMLKLFAYASLCNKPIDVEIANQVIREYASTSASESKDLRIETVEKIVGEYFGVSTADLHSAKRSKGVAQARAIAMFLVRKHTPMSFPEIGKHMGNKNHSTVVLACQKIEGQLTSKEQICWSAGQSLMTKPLSGVIEEIEGQMKKAV